MYARDLDRVANNAHGFHRILTTHTKHYMTWMTREQSLPWPTGGMSPHLLSVLLMCHSHSSPNICSFQATATYLSSTNTAANESIPDSGLINNAGRYVGGPEVPWSRINVVQGKRYRLRLINSSGNARYRFAIPGHSLTVSLTASIVIGPTTDKIGGRSLK
jgi:FtsP/CotA-like multicopper oxidase with cupredoxin domain